MRFSAASFAFLIVLPGTFSFEYLSLLYTCTLFFIELTSSLAEVVQRHTSIADPQRRIKHDHEPAPSRPSLGTREMATNGRGGEGAEGRSASGTGSGKSRARRIGSTHIAYTNMTHRVHHLLEWQSAGHTGLAFPTLQRCLPRRARLARACWRYCKISDSVRRLSK